MTRTSLSVCGRTAPVGRFVLRPSRRGLALAEFITALAIFSLAVGGYFALSSQKNRALRFSSGRQFAVLALQNQLERLSAGNIAADPTIQDATPRSGSPGEGWIAVRTEDLLLPDSRRLDDAIWFHRRPVEPGLSEWRIGIDWHDGERWYHLFAETLRREP